MQQRQPLHPVLLIPLGGDSVALVPLFGTVAHQLLRYGTSCMVVFGPVRCCAAPSCSGTMKKSYESYKEIAPPVNLDGHVSCCVTSK